MLRSIHTEYMNIVKWKSKAFQLKFSFQTRSALEPSRFAGMRVSPEESRHRGRQAEQSHPSRTWLNLAKPQIALPTIQPIPIGRESLFSRTHTHDQVVQI